MTKIIQRHDTSTNWTSINPILALGEMGIETDTNKFKFGDGVTNWTSLSYASAEGGGGGADLSNYYTKDETYNQEEVDNLLDTKQDVLTPVLPLAINYINISPITGYTRPTENTLLPSTRSFTNKTAGYELLNTSYIEFPYIIGEVIKVPYYIDATSSDADASYGAWVFGNKNETTNTFIPYIYAPSGSYAWTTIRQNDTGELSTNNIYPTTSISGGARGTGAQNKTPGYVQIQYEADELPYIYHNVNYFSGSSRLIRSWRTPLSSITAFNISDINYVRFYPGGPSSFYNTELNINEWGKFASPDNLNPFYLYSETELGSSIIDLSSNVESYNLNLKYDNQTIQVNSDGELVANLDELGNEVNTLAGRVAGVETNLTDKANVDLSNCTQPYITESYVNGASGYIKYSNGYYEEWGIITGVGSANGVTVTFLNPFKDTNYNVIAMVRDASTAYATETVRENDAKKTVSSTNFITTYVAEGGGRGYAAYSFNWQVRGYIA